MKNNDFDYIASKFEEENISSPDELSEENIKAKLEKGTSASSIVKFPKNNKRFFKTAVSIAAAIALIVVSLTGVNYYNKSQIQKVIEENTDVDTGLVYFKSYDEIDKLMDARVDEMPYGFFKNDTAKSSDILEESAMDSATKTTGAAPSHSETYKQVEAVDESDIVKTDGEYIYTAEDYGSKVYIWSAKDGKTKKVSTIDLTDDEIIPSELYIKDNKLILISNKDEYNKDKEWQLNSLISVYDISNRSEPKLDYEYKQSGNYSSSRMIGDCVYLISSYGNFYKNHHFIPCCTVDDGEFDKMSYNDICAVKDSESSDYTIIGAIDISKKKSNKTKAIIGTSSDVYCNENNLYVAGRVYKAYEKYDDVTTKLVKISLDKTNIKITATGSVKGDINNQFSMDEKDGYFRIATTTQTKDGRDINVLYVLDEKLKEVGKVDSFAKNEHIEAVRFIGDMAYVITYERTDPLFIIDLSDPKNPEILGEVKISGFSTLLVPIDEKTLLGIGYATEENDFGEATDGLKLALFDISNPAKPKVIGEKEFGGVDSPAQYNHKALMQNSEEGYFAIPVSVWATDEMHNREGAFVFTVKDGKIKIIKKRYSLNLEIASRCVYIGDFIYVVDTNSGALDSFTLE